MTNRFQPTDSNAAHEHQIHGEKPPSTAPITSSNDNATQLRLKQREALKSFRLTKDSSNSFTIDNGDGTHVKDNRPLPKDARERTLETPKLDKSNDQTAQIHRATAALLENAELHFGAEKIKHLNIAKDDLGSALAAVALGPDVCTLLGPQETHALGKRFLVFGVAPTFGMADEAKKQFAQHRLETVHSGAGNYLTGTAISALLEHVHPAVLATTIVGGGTLFIADQLSSPEHRVRNKELSSISRQIDGASNAELIALMGKTKDLLGPELYKGTFDVVTGTPALPTGAVVHEAVKDEAIALSKIDVRAGLKVLENVGHEAWNTLRPLFEQPGLRPAFAGGVQDFHFSSLMHPTPEASILENNILDMHGMEDKVTHPPIQKVRTAIEDISKKPLFDNLDQVIKANEELLQAKHTPVTSRDQANALAALEDKFLEHMKLVRNEVTSMKSQAEALQAKPDSELTPNERQLIDKFYAAEETLYEVITDRLKNLYGWDKHVGAGIDSGLYSSSGMGTQRRVANKISDLFEHGLERDPDIQSALKANGVSPERAKDWVGLPITGTSGADHAGCDYLLANKNTGEMYTFDITERAANMKTGNFVESRLTNHDLVFTNKDVPNERKHLVIGVADDLAKGDASYRLQSEMHVPRDEANRLIEQREKKQLAEIVVKTITQPSKLNVLDTPLPSAIKYSDATRLARRQVYELWRFRTSLEKLGYSDWARSISKSIGYIYSKNAGLPFLN